MHELSIAIALVEQMEQVARERNATAVPRVTLTVGVLSGVDPEALKGTFPLAAEGTPAAGAELVVEVVEAKVRCRRCGKLSTPAMPFLRCMDCGGLDVEVESGRELFIKSMDIDLES